MPKLDISRVIAFAKLVLWEISQKPCFRGYEKPEETSDAFPMENSRPTYINLVWVSFLPSTEILDRFEF